MPRPARFEAVVAALPGAHSIVDRDLRYVAANPAYLTATRARLEDLLGRTMDEAFPNGATRSDIADRRALDASIARVFATGESHTVELFAYGHATRDALSRSPRDGARWTSTQTLVAGMDGEPARVLRHTTAAPVDVAVGAPGRALRAIFDQAPVALTILCGPRYVIEVANPRVCEIWGRPESEILGRPLFEALPEITGQGLEELLAGVLATGVPHVGTELPVKVKRDPRGAPQDVYFNFVYQPVHDDDGQVRSILVVANDVTELVTSRRRAQAQSAELEAVFASFPESIYVTDGAKVTRANAGALAMFGAATVAALPPAVDTLLAALHMRSAVPGVPLPPGLPEAWAGRGAAATAVSTIHHATAGEDRVMLVAAAPVYPARDPPGAVVIHVDITERQRTKNELRQFANVLDATHDFVGIATLDGRPTFVNRGGRQLVGLDATVDLTTLHVSDFVPEGDRVHLVEVVLPAVLRDGYWEGELLLRHFAGDVDRPVLGSVFLLRNAAGEVTALATVNRDLRAIKLAEAERARLLASEREARAQAEEANRLKDEFIATVSHELRTPLTAILGWTSMLRGQNLSPEKRAQGLAIVERNARAQAQLIEELLDVSRILLGKLALAFEPTDLAALVTDAVESARPAADAKSIALEVLVDTVGVVPGDTQRLLQVVSNLVGNALKFTPAGGRVTVALAQRADVVELRVSDTGRGITPAFLPHVFERFRQAEGGTARQLGGLGLGLSIARHIVEAHGGTVNAASEGAGRGATFTVRLPVFPSTQRILAETVWDVESRISLLELPPALDGLRVLVVDDETDTRELVHTLLTRARARVIEARNAVEALALVTRERPDVIVSDIGMPGTDGYALIRLVRALPPDAGGATPAVALSAYARPEDHQRALQAGFESSIGKPIDPADLFAVVAKAAARTGAPRGGD